MVSDAHVLLWWLGAADKLSSAARQALRRAAAERPVRVSSIGLFEITTAARRGRLALSLPAEDWLAHTAALPEVLVEPVTSAIAARAGRIGDELRGNPGDRLIVATALQLALPLMTADARLHAVPGLKAIW